MRSALKDKAAQAYRQAKQLGKKSSEIRPGQSLQDLGADELDLIEAVMALEEQLQISIADDPGCRGRGSRRVSLMNSERHNPSRISFDERLHALRCFRVDWIEQAGGFEEACGRFLR